MHRRNLDNKLSYAYPKILIYSLSLLSTIFGLENSAQAEFLLPRSCRMGQCWETKFISKELFRTGNKGKLYKIQTSQRTWKGQANPPDTFTPRPPAYVYCSTIKPAFIYPFNGKFVAHLINPGKDWVSSNRPSHIRYWATCHNFVGPDYFSNTMTMNAVRLGYSLQLSSEEIDLNSPLDIME